MKEKMRRLQSKGRSKQRKTTEDRHLDTFVPKVSAGVQSQADSSELDPIQAQILYVKSLLREAEDQGRMEEVKLLSTNLQALETAWEIKSQEDKPDCDDNISVQSSCIESNPFEAQINYIEQLIEEKRSQGAN